MFSIFIRWIVSVAIKMKSFRNGTGLPKNFRQILSFWICHRSIHLNIKIAWEHSSPTLFYKACLGLLMTRESVLVNDKENVSMKDYNKENNLDALRHKILKNLWKFIKSGKKEI